MMEGRSDQIGTMAGKHRTQHQTQEDSPWYLDYFGDDPLAQTPTYGQIPQKGLVQLRYTNQPECVTQIDWSIDGNAEFAKTSNVADCMSIHIGALGTTNAGAIQAHALIKGTYHGHQFSYADSSSGCPPPGEYEDREAYYQYTGHEPHSMTAGVIIHDTPTQVPASGTYTVRSMYYMKVLDDQNNPMLGAYVQERWDSIDGGGVTISSGAQANTFTVNLKDEIWTTGRRSIPSAPRTGEHQGMFLSPDYFGYTPTPVGLFPTNTLLITGVHHYWAGTGWCKSLDYSSFYNQWLPEGEGTDPTPTAGLGVNLHSYTVYIKGQDAWQQ
jgi:hypothetical protein